jgi:uncharacterized protein YprB with RNaseH-like and TPR domain
MPQLEPYRYSRINPLRWSEKEIETRQGWTCPHRHNGVQHPRCYNDAHGIVERKGFLDLETSNLSADFGTILTWCFKDLGSDTLWYDFLTDADVRSGDADKRIVSTLVDTLWQFDRIVGHYSTYFDVPFMRTRVLHWKLPFPQYGMLWHSDVWMMARKKLKLHSNRQDSVAESLHGDHLKTRLSPDVWNQVLFGSASQRQANIKEVLHHNEQDVLEGARNYETLLPYVRETRTSI